MAVLDIDDSNFEQSLAENEAAIVDFYADWCGPCFLFSRSYKFLSGEYPHVTFFKLDGEQSPNARATVEIPGLPYFAIYKNGVFQEGLATSKEDAVRALIERHFAAPTGGGAE